MAEEMVDVVARAIEDQHDEIFRASGLVADVFAAIDAAGYAVVPKEPTQAMLNAVTAADQAPPFNDKEMRGVYLEMLAAAK